MNRQLHRENIAGINSLGSMELTGSEIEQYRRDGKVTHTEWAETMLDAWRETMGLDAPIPDELEASNMPSLDALAETVKHDSYNPTTRHDRLNRVRRELPFVQIMPLPHTTRALICSGSTDYVQLPDGCYAVRFGFNRNTGQNYVIDMTGSPIEFANSVTPGAQFSNAAVLNPSDMIYFVDGTSSIAVVGASGAPFTIECWISVE